MAMKRPPLKDVQNYFWDKTKDYELSKLEGEKFWDYYQSCGWLVSKGKPMVSWKSSINNWLKNMSKFTPKSEVKFIIPTIKPDEKEREETRKGYDRLRGEARFSKENGFGTDTQERIKTMLRAGSSTAQIVYLLGCRRELVYNIKFKLSQSE